VVQDANALGRGEHGPAGTSPPGGGVLDEEYTQQLERLSVPRGDRLRPSTGTGAVGEVNDPDPIRSAAIPRAPAALSPLASASLAGADANAFAETPTVCAFADAKPPTASAKARSIADIVGCVGKAGVGVSALISSMQDCARLITCI
jgi:hypothetical protein